MSRLRGLYLFALLGTILVVSSAASANTGTPFFHASASYAASGAHPIKRVNAYSSGAGNGSNAVKPRPTFSLSTGVATSVQNSTSTGARYGVSTATGLFQLPFTCNGTCVNGRNSFSVDWNVTWHAYATTNCLSGGNSSVYWSTVMAGTWVQLRVEVTDGGRGVRPVATYHTWLFAQALYAPGTVSGGATAQNYNITFNADLSPGTTYELSTYFRVSTLASPLNTGGPVCSSTASASLGGATPTVLDSVTIT